MKYLLAAVVGLLSLLVLLTIQPGQEHREHDVSGGKTNARQSKRFESTNPPGKQVVSGPSSAQQRLELEDFRDTDVLSDERQQLVDEVRREIEVSHGITLSENLTRNFDSHTGSDTFENNAKMLIASFAGIHLHGKKRRERYGSKPLSDELKERVEGLRVIDEQLLTVAREMDRARNRDMPEVKR